MYAARGPARPQAGHGAAHNRTRTPSRGVTLPRRSDYRRAVTRVKDACGAGQAGRAEARSLTRASRAHERAAARERDTRGRFTMPCEPLCGRETAGRTPLDTGPLLQGCTLTRHLSLCSSPLRPHRPLDAVPEAYHNPAAVWWGAFAASLAIRKHVIIVRPLLVSSVNGADARAPAWKAATARAVSCISTGDRRWLLSASDRGRR